jgi:TrpR-related protein YerC/YecD
MIWKNKKNQRFLEAILSLESKNEAERFLRDLMTEKEIEEFGKRLEVAEMLMESIPYTVIVQKTGLSSTTVARVAKWLKESNKGYQSVINKLNHHDSIARKRGLS